MAEDNLELVRRGFDALAEGGVDGVLPYVSDDFEATTPSSLAAEPDTYRGHEGIRRWFDSFYDAVDQIRFERRGELQQVGDNLVIVPFTLSARGRATQLEFSQEAVMLWEARDGKAVRLDLFPTLEEAQAAAKSR